MIIQSQSSNSGLSNHAHWLLRGALAGVFLYHGTLKMLDLQGFSEMLSLPVFTVFYVALAQVGGSLLLLLGGLGRNQFFDLVTRVGAAMNIPVMAGAIALVHWGRWNFVPSQSHPLGGMEFQVVLSLIMLYLVFVGNREFSPRLETGRRDQVRSKYYGDPAGIFL